MADFDPDAYLTEKKKQVSVSSSADDFDPDSYLTEKSKAMGPEGPLAQRVVNKLANVPQALAEGFKSNEVKPIDPENLKSNFGVPKLDMPGYDPSKGFLENTRNTVKESIGYMRRKPVVAPAVMGAGGALLSGGAEIADKIIPDNKFTQPYIDAQRNLGQTISGAGRDINNPATTIGEMGSYALPVGAATKAFKTVPYANKAAGVLGTGAGVYGVTPQANDPLAESIVGMGLYGAAKGAAAAPGAAKGLAKGTFVNEPGQAGIKIGERVYTPEGVKLFESGKITKEQLVANPKYQQLSSELFGDNLSKAALKITDNVVPAKGKLMESLGETIQREATNPMNLALNVGSTILGGAPWPLIVKGAAKVGSNAFLHNKYDFSPTFAQNFKNAPVSKPVAPEPFPAYAQQSSLDFNQPRIPSPNEFRLTNTVGEQVPKQNAPTTQSPQPQASAPVAPTRTPTSEQQAILDQIRARGTKPTNTTPVAPEAPPAMPPKGESSVVRSGEPLSSADQTSLQRMRERLKREMDEQEKAGKPADVELTPEQLKEQKRMERESRAVDAEMQAERSQKMLEEFLHKGDDYKGKTVQIDDSTVVYNESNATRGMAKYLLKNHIDEIPVIPGMTESQVINALYNRIVLKKSVSIPRTKSATKDVKPVNKAEPKPAETNFSPSKPVSKKQALELIEKAKEQNKNATIKYKDNGELVEHNLLNQKPIKFTIEPDLRLTERIDKPSGSELIGTNTKTGERVMVKIRSKDASPLESGEAISVHKIFNDGKVSGPIRRYDKTGKLL
jgi:hypothetical protein